MAEHLLDARGLICPLPVLKVRKRLLSLSKGDSLRVRVEATAGVDELVLFCKDQGYRYERGQESELVIFNP